ncbi:MAG: Gfo/Idh/MocA family oxidoreductase [Dehalococcoidales bacterium]|nr:Gfo/Idh/MocA family oxidoreductase [Dehalococcoidales bacterium]
MPENRLKVGIVGCGAIASLRHVPAFSRLRRDVVLRAVCDTNRALAEKLARRYGIPGVYTDIAQMLEREKLDIVDICTPPQTHAVLALQAIAAGCHVLMEKPMALRTSECDEMLRLSREKGVKVGVVHNQLFYPPFVKAREMVARGDIGDLIGMRIFMADPSDEMIMRKDYWVHRLPGGAIGESAPHAVYRSAVFIGSVKGVEVSARCLLEHPWAPFDYFQIELEGERGTSSITISYPGSYRASTVDLIGTEGMLHLDLLRMLLVHQKGRASMSPFALALAAKESALQMIGGVLANAAGTLTGRGRFYGHNSLIEAFVESLVHGKPLPVTAEDGRETVRVMEMIVSRLRQKYAPRT